MRSERDEATLRAYALSFPEAYEEFPWGERAIKIRAKVFVFMRAGEDGLSMSVKLPASRDMAHDLPFAEPTGYGLGKHGWVTARFPKRTRPPIELLKEWIDESYRAVAPKKVVAQLAFGSTPAKVQPKRAKQSTKGARVKPRV